MQHQIVSREQWLQARIALKAKEKAFTQMKDALAVEQRALPWVRIEKDYVFDTPSGKQSLGALFQGRSQLFIKHYMMGPGQQHHCVGCSLEVDHLSGIQVHLENHDVTYTAVARAPLAEINALKVRMGWKIPFVSSFGSDFNYDFNVSFTPAQIEAKKAFYNFRETDPFLSDLSGDSIFYRNEAGEIFHTYSAFGRGAEAFLTVYEFLDLMPKGRNEEGPYRMLTDWARPNDMYGKGGMVEPTGRYHEAGCGCAVHQ